MKLAQYKVQLDDSHKFDNVIYRYQKFAKDPRPDEIHSELLFDDGDMFSSSGRGWSGWIPGIGTRFIHYSDIELEKWRIYNLIISGKDEVVIKDLCFELLGRYYDWLGILGQPVPFNFQITKWFYCSEVCNHVLTIPKIAEVNKKLRPGCIVDSWIRQGIIQI
jgi:hypothetical protein